MSQEKDNKDVLVKVRNLKTYFYTYAGVVKALEGVDLDIYKGVTVGLVGETGCGKSVTARSIMRLIDEPGEIVDGEVWFDGRNLLELDEEEMREIRGGEIAMVFQDPMTYLNPVFTIGDQIVEAIIYHQDLRLDVVNMKIEELNEKLTNLKKELNEKLQSKELTDSEKENTKKMINREMESIKSLIKEYEKLKQQVIEAQKKEEELRKMKNKLKKLQRLEKEREKLSKELKSHKNTNVGSQKSLSEIEARLKELSNVSEEKKKLEKEIKAFEKQIKSPKFSKKDILAAARKRAVEALRLVRMPYPESVLDQYPHELSGGMRQRAMIAMMLTSKPKLFIADEATTALDVTIQAQILRLLQDLKEQLDSSILFITHDLGVVAQICDYVAVMYAGRIIEFAEVHELFKNPQHPYTKGLLNAIPKLYEKEDRLETIPGVVPDLINPPSGCRFHPRCKFAKSICSKQRPPVVKVGPEHYVACWLFTENYKLNSESGKSE
ncbi:MAG: ATP-binding cassette domain-containing protein [Candidatus Odinarchaeota archaeon]|nr:ATP-binding cassette domain-containing protein [Candidatus Odinarchaeota archaeon]